MQKKNLLLLSAASMMILSSCSKLGPLSADNFTVDPNPLETTAGQIPTTINGMFPEKYMKKKATVTVIPELRYGNGEAVQGTGATFQGEKVAGNDQTISYKVGGNYTMKTNFKYVPEMQKSELYLTFDAYIGSKKVDVPAVKVANGVIATSELSGRTVRQAQASVSQDAYQRIIEHKQEANIKFLIQQANLRKSELKNNSVQEFVEMLKKINADKEGLNLKNVEVSAYASPDGGLKLNDKLAAQRQNNTEKYVQKTLKNTKVKAPVDAKYTAQDWEGFQELVKVSDIQDKDVIIRVLSMYKDPEEREQQIKNMSAGFRELAENILPELRRSRLIINYETVGRSDEQIQDQYKADAKQLSIDEILYAATLKGANAEEIYKTAATVYPNDYRGYNNVAVQALKKGDVKTATEYLEKALKVNANAPEVKANLALVALKSGNVNKAQELIAQAIDANDYKYALGTFNIAKGDYATAAENLKGQNNNIAALAQILSKDYEGARNTFKQIGNNGDGMTDYLRAIMSARQGNAYAANTYLKDAIAKDGKLAFYAENDLEFSKVK